MTWRAGQGSKAIAVLRQSRQEDARDRIDVASAFAALTKVEKTLDAKWETLNRNQIAALSKRADIAFRKLNKVVPDERIVEDAPGQSQSKIEITWKDPNGNSNPVPTEAITISDTSTTEAVEPVSRS